MLASDGGTASIFCARISIIAIDRGFLASSSYVVTHSQLAGIRSGTVDGSVLASVFSRRNLNTARIDGAWIIVIAISSDELGGTARLSISLTNSAPISIRAVNHKRSGDFHVGLGGVAFAIEEIEFVARTGGGSGRNEALDGIEVHGLR